MENESMPNIHIHVQWISKRQRARDKKNKLVKVIECKNIALNGYLNVLGLIS